MTTMIKRIGDAVVADLADRGGVGNELSMVDAEVMEEIKEAIGTAALKVVEEQASSVRKALESLIDMLQDVERRPQKDPQYGHLVEALGEEIGYGALMSSAEASWRESMARKGHPVGGEFVAGPCRAVFEKRLAKAREALSEGEAP